MINDEDVNLYDIVEAEISRISEMCYDIMFALANLILADRPCLAA